MKNRENNLGKYIYQNSNIINDCAKRQKRNTFSLLHTHGLAPVARRIFRCVIVSFPGALSLFPYYFFLSLSELLKFIFALGTILFRRRLNFLIRF